MQITATEMIAVAREQVGYVESANGKTKYGTWYAKRRKDAGFEAAAWCDMSLVWCAWEAGRRKGGADAAETALRQIGEYAYTPWHAGYWARKGRFSSRVRVGDLVFFDWSGSKKIGDIDHVELAIGTAEDGLIVTLGGNTLRKDGKSGFQKRYRSRAAIVGFAHPMWAVPGKVDPKPPKPNAEPDKYPLATTKWYGPGGVTSGEPIRRIQTRLVELGAQLTIDGDYGPQTTQAVKKFQEKAGVISDGHVGPITWAKLF